MLAQLMIFNIFILFLEVSFWLDQILEKQLEEESNSNFFLHFAEGPCRNTLTTLQHDYKLNFKYEGKVWPWNSFDGKFLCPLISFPHRTRSTEIDKLMFQLIFIDNFVLVGKFAYANFVCCDEIFNTPCGHYTKSLSVDCGRHIIVWGIYKRHWNH
jgi:hypothetical protein